MGARPAFVAPNDQPWAQTISIWRDAARTLPAVLTGAGGWLQWPGGSTKIALEASCAGGVLALDLPLDVLSTLRTGTWWGEAQFEVDGLSVGSARFDLQVSAGFGTGLGAPQSLGQSAALSLCGDGMDIILLDQGPSGPPGAGSALQRRSAEALSGQRVVKDVGGGLCDYASPSQPADAALVLGLTTTAAPSGEIVQVQCQGDMTDGAWSWTPDLPLFVGPQGQLTQTPPTSGWLMRVGVAVSPTAIVIGLQPAIQLL